MNAKPITLCRSGTILESNPIKISVKTLLSWASSMIKTEYWDNKKSWNTKIFQTLSLCTKTRNKYSTQPKQNWVDGSRWNHVTSHTQNADLKNIHENFCYAQLMKSMSYAALEHSNWDVQGLISCQIIARWAFLSNKYLLFYQLKWPDQLKRFETAFKCWKRGHQTESCNTYNLLINFSYIYCCLAIFNN